MRCQAVLEALRGRFDTARALIATARATTEEIGLRHGLLETEFFAGIVELLAGEPAAAEPPLRLAYGGLGQLGIGADAGQAAAYLARALLLQGRLDEADELATDSDALAGQNPQTAIAARSAMAEILAVRGDTPKALTLAEEAVRLAAGTDIILDHANALATLARVRAADGDIEGADRASTSARELFTQKGATVLVDLARIDGRPFAVPTSRSPHGNATTPRVARDSDEAWNMADRWARRANDVMASNDIDALSDRFEDDYRSVDHRPLVGGQLTSKAEAVEMLRQVSAILSDRVELVHEPIAVRGERLVLRHAHWRSADDPAGSVVEMVDVVEYSDRGRLVRTSTYETSDLHLALQELDEWFLSKVDPDHVGTIQEIAIRLASFTTTGESDAAQALLHPSIEAIDHRAIGWATSTGREAMRGRIESVGDLPGESLAFMVRWRPFDGWVGVAERCLRTISPDGAQQESRTLSVGVFDPATGLLIRHEMFDVDDLAEALARCEEIGAAQADQLVNDAVLAGGIANHRVRADVIGHFLNELGDDFVAEGIGTEGWTVTADDLRSGRTEPTALGYGVEFRQVISIIGDRLTMLYVETDGGERRFSVEEIDEGGRLTRIRHFPSTDLIEATNHLEARWRAIEDLPASVVAMNRWEERQRAKDPSGLALANVSAPEFTLTDHRALGIEPLDWEGIAVPVADADLGVLLPVRIHAMSASTVVAKSAMVAVSPSGDIWEAFISTTVFAHRNGLATHVELFAEDDLAGALARAAEIDPEGFDVEGAGPSDGNEPWNEADRLSRTCKRLIQAGDLAGFADMLSEDHRGEDRRTGVRTVLDKAESVRSAAALLEVVGPISLTWTTVASRGHDFALVLEHWTRDDDPNGPAADILRLARFGDGLLAEDISFDPSDLGRAVAELDRMYMETLDGIESEVRAAVLRFEQALNDGDLDRMMAMFHPDFAFADHRPLGWGPDSRVDAVRERFRTLTQGHGSVFRYTAKVHRQTGQLECASCRLVVDRPEGGQLIDDQIVVSRLDAATGLVIRSDQFADDRLDEALACFDATRAEIDNVIPAANAAALAGGWANNRALTAPRDDFGSMFADDFVATLVDGTTVTFDDLRSGRLAPQAIGFGITDRRIVSVFGEQLALIGVGPDNGTQHWSIEEVDADCRLARLRQFPIRRFAGAVDHAHVRFAAIDRVRPAIRAMIALNHAQFAGDREQYESYIADEFEFVDRRELGFGRADKGQYIDLQFTGVDSTEELGVLFARCVLAETDEVAVISFARYFITEDGGFWEVGNGFAVNTALDGRVSRIETFGDDALDEALARAAELDPNLRRRSGERGGG